MSNKKVKGDKNGRYTAWCFTSPVEPLFVSKEMRYMCYQKEMGSKTGYEHFQGYVEMFAKCSMKHLKDKIFELNEIHLEPRAGSQDQAIDYCKKSETSIGEFMEFGKKSQRGERSDLNVLVEEIVNGRSIRQIIAVHGGHAMRYINHIEKVQKHHYNPGALDLWLEAKQKIDEGDDGSIEYSMAIARCGVYMPREPEHEFINGVEEQMKDIQKYKSIEVRRWSGASAS